MAEGPLVLTDMSYGQNDGDPPLSLANNAAEIARNVDLGIGRLAQRRAGCVSVSTGTLTMGPHWMARHNAGAATSQDELFAGESAEAGGSGGLVIRNQSATGTWSAATPLAGWEYPAYGMRVRAASFNGKLFLAYKSEGAIDRLHVWDGTNLRRVGLATPAVATVANTGSGTYAATIRYYKIRWAVQVASVTVKRSEASPVVSFTPSGSGTAARVTQSTPPGEGETHWEVYGSAAGLTYVLLATVAIATTTYDDTTLPSAYSGAADPLVGFNTVPKSCAYLLTDDTRLLLASELESGHRSRVYFTAVLGDADIGDDERIPNTVDQQNWIDLDDKNGEPLTGLGGPIFGQILAFKKRHIWRLIPTGNALSPYRALKLSDTVGAVGQDSVVLAEDEFGNPALYFLTFRGPYRWSSSGLEYVGRDIETLWDTVTWTNLGSNFHGVYYQHHHEIWWWIQTSAGWIRLRLNTRMIRAGRGGWVVDDGAATTTATTCSVMYLPTLTSPSSVYVPYSGGGATPLILRHDSGTTDNGTNFRAYVQTKPFPLATFGRYVSVDPPTIIGVSTDNAVVSVTINRDFGLETKTTAVSFEATGAEARVIRKLEDLALGEAGVVQFVVGDADLANQSWTIEGLLVPYWRTDPR